MNFARLSAAVVLSATVATANAGVVSFSNVSGSTSTTYVNTNIPNHVFKNPNDDTLYAWDEAQNLTLNSDLVLDSGVTIASGTTISSHMIQWDPSKPYTNGNWQHATVNFDAEIIGFIFDDKKLGNTDSLLGATGINYDSFEYRGLESDPLTGTNDDYIVFSGGNSFDLHMRASNPGDWVRVITAPVPEPSTLGLMFGGLGLVGLMAFRARKESIEA